MSKHCINYLFDKLIFGNSILTHLQNRNKLGHIQSGVLLRNMRYLIIEITLLWM